jgi:molybdopterin-containing oxidoreductase family iron-sulfur binding subunit
MKVPRRDFLKISGICAMGLLLSNRILQNVQAADTLAEDKPSSVRWGMVIDLTKHVEGCTDCITACHKAHNVPKVPNKEEEIKWIWTEEYINTFADELNEYLPEDIARMETMVLCNHCQNPPCVRVCPTQATFQRPDGIVMMDYHRCIGCRYCMAACPYGSRSFNFSDPRLYLDQTEPDYPTREIGVVEKCDFCVERLDQGQLPICVEACSYGVLFFGDLNDPQSEVRQLLAKRRSLTRKARLGTQPSVYYLI